MAEQTDFFETFFYEGDEQYPGLGIFTMRPNTLYSYVPSTVLELMLNFFPQDGRTSVLLTKYQHHISNREAVDRLRTPTAIGPFDLGDNISMLVRVPGSDAYPKGVAVPEAEFIGTLDWRLQETWWFLDFDMDCSDCSVGYFLPRGYNAGQILQSFQEAAKAQSMEGDSKALPNQEPTSYFAGPAIFLPSEIKIAGRW